MVRFQQLKEIKADLPYKNGPNEFWVRGKVS